MSKGKDLYGLLRKAAARKGFHFKVTGRQDLEDRHMAEILSEVAREIRRAGDLPEDLRSLLGLEGPSAKGMTLDDLRSRVDGAISKEGAWERLDELAEAAAEKAEA